jgi:dipeptide/tripeptide permease
MLFLYYTCFSVNPFQPVVEHKITEENTVYIMWLLPQFIVMTAAEIMFSITSLQFSYTQVRIQGIILKYRRLLYLSWANSP